MKNIIKEIEMRKWEEWRWCSCLSICKVHNSTIDEIIKIVSEREKPESTFDLTEHIGKYFKCVLNNKEIEGRIYGTTEFHKFLLAFNASYLNCGWPLSVDHRLDKTARMDGYQRGWYVQYGESNSNIKDFVVIEPLTHDLEEEITRLKEKNKTLSDKISHLESNGKESVTGTEALRAYREGFLIKRNGIIWKWNDGHSQVINSESTRYSTCSVATTAVPDFTKDDWLIIR